MLIAIKQINSIELASFVATAASGAAFSGTIGTYAAASGTFGPNVVYTTGNQSLTGIKTFLLSPVVPYSGSASTVTSAQWSIDKLNTLSGYFNGNFVQILGTQVISGSKTFMVSVGVANPTTTGDAVNLGYLTGVSGVLALATAGAGAPNAVFRTGDQTISGIKTFTGAVFGSPTNTGHAINLGYLTGVSGVIIGQIVGGGGAPNAVFTTGDQTVGGLKTFTGTVFVNSPTNTGHAVNLGYLTGVSGVLAAAGGGGAPNAVFTTGDQTIGGLKTFTGTVFVNSPTNTGHAVNLGYLTGVSGVLSAVVGGGTTNYYYITGTGVVTASSFASGNITNTFYITSGNTNVINSGNNTTNTFNITNGSANINITGVTGNYVNMSFFYDATTLQTGLNSLEGFVGRDFFFTGYAIGAYNSGTQGMFSGSIYQRTRVNTKVKIVDITLTSGMFFTGVGGFVQVVSGMNRVGLDILLIGTGLTGLSVGVFGVGY
jgi:hypothetical protein